MAGAGENFIIAFNRYTTRSRTVVEALRFDGSGARVDEEPLSLSPVGTSELWVNTAAASDDTFAVRIDGSESLPMGASRGLAQYREIPFSGPITAEIVIDASSTPFGSCQTFLDGRNTLVSRLDGAGFQSIIGWGAACNGELLLRWLEGLPGAPTGPGAMIPETTFRAPAAARGNEHVAGVYLFSGAPDGAAAPRFLGAGWIESAVPAAAPAAGARLVLATLDAATGSSPTLAALDDTFLVAWASSADPGSNEITEIRRLRFNPQEGGLDPDGGFVIVGEGGLIRRPEATSDGTHFRLLWGEIQGDSMQLRTQRFTQTGEPVESAPVDVVSIGSNDSFRVAETPSATLVAWISSGTEEEDEACLHVRPIDD